MVTLPPSLPLLGRSTRFSWNTSWPSIVEVEEVPASRQAVVVEWIGAVVDNRHLHPEDAAPENIPVTNIRDTHRLPTMGTKTSTQNANAKKPISHTSKRGFNNKNGSYSLCALIYCYLLHHQEGMSLTPRRHPPPAVAAASPEAIARVTTGLFLAEVHLTITE